MSARAAERRPPRRAVRVVVGVAFGGALLAFKNSLGFASSAFGSSVAAPGAESGSRLTGNRFDVARSDEPRTQMHGKYPDRSRNNNQGGPRLPDTIDRKPVLAYSTTDLSAERPENSNSVIRRMWDMYDMTYNKMALQRQQYFRLQARERKWMGDYFMRLAQRRKKQSVKRQFDEEWSYWMRTEGRRKGLSDPLVWEGPPLRHLLTPEADAESEPDEFRKKLGTTEEIKAALKKLPGLNETLPSEMLEPGKWPTGETSIHNIWRRPLHPKPYDIGKRGGKKIVRANVL